MTFSIVARSASARWAGVENYEERLAPGAIDPRVLAALRAATAEHPPPAEEDPT